MRGELEAWLRAESRASDVGSAAPDDDVRLALLAGGGGSGWRWIGLAWRGRERLPSAVVKFPRRPDDNARAAAEASALRTLAGWQLPGPRRAPRPLGETSIAGRAVTAETAMPGRPLLAHVREQRPPRADAQVDAQVGAQVGASDVASWLAHLARASARALDAAETARLVRAPLADVSPAVDVPDRARRWLAARADQLLSRAPLPAVYTHGDPGPPNVLVDRRGHFAALVDWETAGWGLPVTDLLYFLVRLREETGCGHLTELASVDRLPDSAGPQLRRLRRTLTDHCDAVGVEPDWLPVLAALAWLHHAGNEAAQARSGMSGDVARRRAQAYFRALDARVARA